MSTKAKVIDVNEADFQKQVIEQSRSVPVVVDFWAPWCGPCHMLSPILERLAAAPDSDFILAKVNADHNPSLSNQYGVRGIPAVKAFFDGRVVDEFVGAQPEPMVRQFIQRVAANKQTTAASSRPGPEQASTPAARLEQARQLLRQGKGCEAQRWLEQFPSSPEAASAQKLLPLAQFLCQASRGFSAVNPDLDGLYRQAADAAQRREYSAALYNLLAVLRQNQSYRHGQARSVMQALFELLGDQDVLTQAYRQQLNNL